MLEQLISTISGMTKVMAALSGEINSSPVEVLDISKPFEKCDNLPEFPEGRSQVLGALTFLETPYLCQASVSGHCYMLNHGTWARDSAHGELNVSCTNLANVPRRTEQLRMVAVGLGGTIHALDKKTWKALPTLKQEAGPGSVQPSNFSVGACLIFDHHEVVWALAASNNRNYFMNITSKTPEWIRGHPLLTSRKSPVCGRIRKDRGSLEMSIIVVGGVEEKTCERKDEGILSKWEPAPGEAATRER